MRLKEAIRKMIRKKFPKIRYWGNCWMFRNDASYRDTVNAITNEPYLFYFHNLGELNPDSNICIMGTDDRGITQGGLMSELRNLLVRFAMCEHFHLLPVVEFKNSLYDDGGSERGMNAFEYYFEQPVGISVEDAKNSRYVYFARGIDVRDFKELNVSYEIDNRQLDRFSVLYRKYLHLNESTDRMLASDIERLLGDKKVLGVHIRGGDFNGFYNGHPVPLMPEDYYEDIDRLFSIRSYDCIFLASDDDRIFARLSEKYGNKIISFSDNMRTKDNTGIHSKKNKETGEGYRKGYEVLRDAYALAGCEDLITGLSGVGSFARIVRKAKYAHMRDAVVLSKGICHCDKQFPQRR